MKTKDMLNDKTIVGSPVKHLTVLAVVMFAFWFLLSGKVDFLIVFTAVALAFIAFLVFAKKFDTKMEEFCFTLILAGGIGNLIDRVSLGYVIDYIYFELINFPIFNFADCCVVVGCGLMILYVLLDDRKTAKLAKEQ